MQYRGVLPVCADPSLGSPDGAILKAALEEVSSWRNAIRSAEHVHDLDTATVSAVFSTPGRGARDDGIVAAQ